jgi:hypothetical protein
MGRIDPVGSGIRIVDKHGNEQLFLSLASRDAAYLELQTRWLTFSAQPSNRVIHRGVLVRKEVLTGKWQSCRAALTGKEFGLFADKEDGLPSDIIPGWSTRDMACEWYCNIIVHIIKTGRAPTITCFVSKPLRLSIITLTDSIVHLL